MKPRYSTCADLKLAMALREYDTLDHRPDGGRSCRVASVFARWSVRVDRGEELSRTRFMYKCTLPVVASIMSRLLQEFTLFMQVVIFKS